MSSLLSLIFKNEFFVGVLRYNLFSRIGEWVKLKVVMYFKRVNYWCLIGLFGLIKFINFFFNVLMYIFYIFFE